MEDFYRISFETGEFFEVRTDLLENWFPAFWTLIGPNQFINMSKVVRSIKSGLIDHTHVPIKPGTVANALKELFENMEPKPFQLPPYTPEVLLVRKMKEHLKKDIRELSSSGLHRSRHRFRTYCFLAKWTGSRHLAESMVQFFQQQASRIMEIEDQGFLIEWYCGILDLRGLIPDHTVQELLHAVSTLGSGVFRGWRRPGYYDPHAGFVMRKILEAQQNHPFHHRGRAPLMLGGPPGWIPRARSLPPNVRRRRPDLNLQIGYPRFPSSAWASPVMSPALYPRSGDLDDVSRLQWQQEEMNSKLENIDRKLDYLIEY